MSGVRESKTVESRDVKGLSRDRPWLLPSNRKLRHLQGISLRNLTLIRSPARSRGKTIDDESLPHALKTPAKALSQRENKKLEHSRSSNDLKSPLKLNGALKHQESESEVPAKGRPSIARTKRRSTLNWSNASPRARQQKLEDVAAERMADTWFSIHCPGKSEPVYVSETIEKAMNPTFRFFDLNIYGPSVTRLDDLTIKYWARTESMKDYLLLIEFRVNLRSLQFIGRTLETFHHPLPPNSILFHLSDGIYTSFTDLPLEEAIVPATKSSKPTKQAHNLQSTSSFDALMRLSNLDNCIQDALATREKLTSQINRLLEEQKESLNIINSASQEEEHLASTNRSLSTCRRQIRTAQARRSELQASISARRSAIASGKQTQQKAEADLLSSREKLTTLQTCLQTTKTALSGQIRRIAEDLSTIYPIASISPGPLTFTIRDLHLPNAGGSPSITNTDSTDPEETVAALGLVAHATHLLSFYLSTPLPYPITPHGSTSTILDPISTNMPSVAARTFPLYQRGAVAYRFEYGVFLLNSDIELLMSKQGSRMVDLRHTLPNLKYLLTVLTAGKGEVPGRKRGEVRALGNGKVGEGERVRGVEKEVVLNGEGDLMGDRGGDQQVAG